MNNLIADCYQPLFDEHKFIKVENNGKFNSAGECWELSHEIGEGYYWIYAQKDLYDIKIHDFYFHEDSFMTFELPECLSITQYESISDVYKRQGSFSSYYVQRIYDFLKLFSLYLNTVSIHNHPTCCLVFLRNFTQFLFSDTEIF